MTSIESDIKEMIVDALRLEDLSPDDIGTDEPLFGQGGLGLDSIDALELGVALRKKYGIKIDTSTGDVHRHFLSVRTLTAFVISQRQGDSA